LYFTWLVYLNWLRSGFPLLRVVRQTGCQPVYFGFHRRLFDRGNIPVDFKSIPPID
jgi:hypothetical protein